MGIIGTIFIGLIVGLLARFLKPGDDSMGWIMTIVLGIAGSLAATYGGQALGIYQAGEGAGFLGALVGAIILLVIYGMIKRNNAYASALCFTVRRGLECSATVHPFAELYHASLPVDDSSAVIRALRSRTRPVAGNRLA